MDPEVRNLITYPTWERSSVLANVVLKMDNSTRKYIVNEVHTNLDPNIFFPSLGVTLAEYALWTTLLPMKK